MTNERNTCAVCTEIFCGYDCTTDGAVAMPHLFWIENNNNLARALIPFYCAHTLPHTHAWTALSKNVNLNAQKIDSKTDLVIQTQ